MEECSGCQEMKEIKTCDSCGFDYCLECVENRENHQPCSKYATYHYLCCHCGIEIETYTKCECEPPFCTHRICLGCLLKKFSRLNSK